MINSKLPFRLEMLEYTFMFIKYDKLNNIFCNLWKMFLVSSMYWYIIFQLGIPIVGDKWLGGTLGAVGVVS